MRHLILLSLLSVPFGPAVLPAQIPADWGALSVIESPQAPKGAQGGLAAFSPRKPNTWFPITGLSASLKYQLCGAGVRQPIGSNSILVRPTDGALVVGELATGRGATCEIHVLPLKRLPLKGFVVVMKNVASYTLSSNGGSVDQMAWLPDGRIVFVYKAITRAGWPWWGGVGILNLKNGVFTKVPITNWPASSGQTKSIANSLAASADGKTVYLGMYFAKGLALTGELYSLPIAGGPLTLITRFPVILPAGVTSIMPSLQIDNDGQILVATGSRVVRVNPNSRPPVVTLVTTIVNHAIEVDRLTGNYLVGGRVNSAYGVYSVSRKGVITSVTTNMPTTGILAAVRYGGLSGIAMRNAVEMYGNSFPGKNRYSWTMHPGAFPRLGSNFPLIVTSAPGTAPGLIAIGVGRCNLATGLGFNLLTWPNIGILPLAPKTRSQVNVWIPNIKSLKGVIFNAQSIHLQSNPLRLRATRGLQVIIL